MAALFDTATLSVQLRSKEHSMADVSFVVESMENLTIAALCGAMGDPEPRNDVVAKARSLLMEASGSDKAGGRFYPGFREGGFIGFSDRDFLNRKKVAPSRGIDYDFDPYD